MVEFLKPTDRLINHVADDMRRSDVDEVWASHRHSPRDALHSSVNASDFSAVVVAHGEPYAVLGLSMINLLLGHGAPWLLSTNQAVKSKREFITLVPDVIGEMFTHCTVLRNYVHVKNVDSIRWLKRIGFTLEAPVKYGRGGEFFHEFYMTKVN